MSERLRGARVKIGYIVMSCHCEAQPFQTRSVQAWAAHKQARHYVRTGTDENGAPILRPAKSDGTPKVKPGPNKRRFKRNPGQPDTRRKRRRR